MSTRKRKEPWEGWPQAYAAIDFKPVRTPSNFKDLHVQNWAERTEGIRQATVIAAQLCSQRTAPNCDARQPS